MVLTSCQGCFVFQVESVNAILVLLRNGGILLCKNITHNLLDHSWELQFTISIASSFDGSALDIGLKQGHSNHLS